MILTNLDHVKGREIKKGLGLAFGYAAVTATGKGKKGLSMDGEPWPWADTPDHFEALFREAEKKLVSSAGEMDADAVIKIEARLSRDERGHPEMLIVGTAVKLSPPTGAAAKPPVKEKTGEINGEATEGSMMEGDDKGIHITIDGESAAWKMDPSTATKDVLRMLRQHDDGQRGKGPEGPGPSGADLQSLAEVMGISFERAQQLSSAGLSSLELIAGADLKRLMVLSNLNPTQARLIKARAKELLAGK